MASCSGVNLLRDFDADYRATDRYQRRDDWSFDMPVPATKNCILSESLDAMLLLGLGPGPEPINNLSGLERDPKELKEDLLMSQKAIATRMPPLASKDMTWKTVRLSNNLTIGSEESDDESDSDTDTVFSPHETDDTSESDTSEVLSEGLTVSPPKRFRSITRVAAELPRLTTFEDTDGTKLERLSIFENDCFEIRRSRVAGWGAFSTKTLRRGDCILVEKALYHATHEHVQMSVKQLPEKEKMIANDLHAFYGRQEEPKEEAIWNSNAFASRSPGIDAVTNKNTGAYQNTAGLFPVAARFNHSCAPKIDYKFRVKDQVLVFTVLSWIIEAGEELTISYGKEPSVLFYRFGFNCECGYCGGFDPQEWDY